MTQDLAPGPSALPGPTLTAEELLRRIRSLAETLDRDHEYFLAQAEFMRAKRLRSLAGRLEALADAAKAHAVLVRMLTSQEIEP